MSEESLTPERDALWAKHDGLTPALAAELLVLAADLEKDRDEWKQRAAKAHAEMMAMKERLMKLADSFAEDAKSHRKHSDAASAETTKICHLSAWDAYKNADRRVMDAVHGETAF